MPRLFKSSNKSQASIEKIADSRDSLANRSPNRDSSPSRDRDSVVYPPHQGQFYGLSHPSLQPPPPPQQQQQQQQQYTDERYYNDAAPTPYQQPQQAAPHPAHVLSRTSSNRLSTGSVPVNAYQEQQQIHNQRPTISLVNPNRQQESIAEDDPNQHQLGRTQFGPSTPVRTSAPKEEKRSRNSGIRGFFTSGKDKKEGKESPADPSRLSRHGSVLKRTQQSPTSPQQQQYPPPAQRGAPVAQQGAAPQSIAAHLRDLSQENLPEADQHDEQYYRYQRPPSQFDIHPQEQARPSIPDYAEDAPHFAQQQQQPSSQQQQQQQQQQQHPPQYQQQIYHQQNASQSQIEHQRPEEKKDFLLYQGQPTRDRPSGLPHHAADDSLRPPSQSSLGPPSPLGNPPPLNQRQSTSNPPRYSVQSVQAYQAAQQAASQIQQQNQNQAQPPPQEAHQAQPPQSQQTGDEMGNRDRDRDRQRDSRMEESDQQRYAAAQQDPRVRMSTAQDQGRNTPPPRGGREDVQAMDHQTLLLRYEELQAKYSKVKRYYFDREAQVTQLQNTVANQRLSMSKTSLDDAQYATRFERLNGAIQNLAFNIRKDWRRVPNWLAPACNRDACATGTREMTAVGRACISRWLYEHVFESIFHPGIDPTLSAQLKYIERCLRRAPSMLTEEQRDDLLTKVTTWRLTTCEGLHDVLNSRQNEHNTEQLSRMLADQLCEHLKTLLNDPAPPGLDGYLLPIVAQTLSIAANLPLESRDICIEYYWPGIPINETFMKLESGMTPLVNPGSAPTRDDNADELESVEDDQSGASNDDVANVEEQIREAVRGGTSSASAITQGTSRDSKKDKKSGGFFSSGFSGGLVNKKPAPAPSSSRGPSSSDLAQQAMGESGTHAKPPDGVDEEKNHAWNFDVLTRGQKEGKIRFAVFFAVEVRGKSLKSGAENGATGGEAKQGNGTQAQNGTQNANVGVASNSGTSGGAGTGGVNVLVKAPVFGF